MKQTLESCRKGIKFAGADGGGIGLIRRTPGRPAEKQ